MATRPRINAQVITNGSMTSNLTSKVTVLQDVSMLSYSYSWSGSSPVGTISVQVSNDYSQNADGSTNNVGTWNTLTFSSGGSPTTTLSVSGNTGSGFVDIYQTGSYAIRTIYTAGSGTGTLNATINGKVS